MYLITLLYFWQLPVSVTLTFLFCYYFVSRLVRYDSTMTVFRDQGVFTVFLTLGSLFFHPVLILIQFNYVFGVHPRRQPAAHSGHQSIAGL